MVFLDQVNIFRSGVRNGKSALDDRGFDCPYDPHAEERDAIVDIWPHELDDKRSRNSSPKLQGAPCGSRL